MFQHVLVCMAIVSLIDASGFVQPLRTEIFYASQPNNDHEPAVTLFTPSTTGQYTLPQMKSLENYEIEIQRSVDYPARGKSTFYYYYYTPNGASDPEQTDGDASFDGR